MQRLLPKKLKTLAKVGGSSGNGLPTTNLPSDNFRYGPDRKDTLSPPIQCGDWELLERYEEDERPKIILPGNRTENRVEVDLINFAGHLTTRFASEIKEGKFLEPGKEYSEQERGEIAFEHARNALQDPDSLVLTVKEDNPRDAGSVEMAEIKEKLARANNSTIQKVRDVLNEGKSLSPDPESSPTIATSDNPTARGANDLANLLQGSEKKSNTKAAGGGDEAGQWSFELKATLVATAAVATVLAIGFLCPSAGKWLAVNFGSWFSQIASV
mmetsp:Transcript_3092/g.5850  ORF Transcript_3092/g.5850 Transcript_3092/m.5850 type:complete len:271 (-) Transcript_3092:205-1017(-)